MQDATTLQKGKREVYSLRVVVPGVCPDGEKVDHGMNPNRDPIHTGMELGIMETQEPKKR
jgi:hypothetical protein